MIVDRIVTLTGRVVLKSTGIVRAADSDADYWHQLSTLYRVFSRARTANAVAVAPTNGCTLAPDAYLFVMIDRAVQTEAGKLTKRQQTPGVTGCAGTR
jgi:hypothetical protein